MQLISGVVSNNAAKVRIVLAEKRLDYETIEVPWSKATAWQPKPEILLQSNPRAEVPVLIDEGLTLWDSTVIVEYLEEKYPEFSLLPSTIEGKALCRLWEDEGDYNQRHVGVLIADVFLAAPGTSNSANAIAALAELAEFCGRLSNQLAQQDYICDSFSVADISVFLTLTFAQTLGLQVEHANVQAWLDRMMARPAIATEIGQIMNAIATL